MGNTQVQTNLITPGQTSGLQNLTDNLLEAFKGILAAKVPGLPNFYKGLRPIESEDVNIPCTMVQPLKQSPSMVTTGKFHKWYAFDFWFCIGDDTVDGTTVRTSDCSEIFVKLFGNNALGDFGQPGFTNKYKANGSLWIDSEMTNVETGVPFLHPRQNGTSKYVALGNFQLKVQTVTLV